MVTKPLQTNPSEVIYPDRNGKTMANNTEQFRWILVIQQNLDWLFADKPTPPKLCFVFPPCERGGD